MMRPISSQKADPAQWRFLVVGLGSIGRRHLANLRILYPAAEILACRHGEGCSKSSLWKSLGADDCCATIEAALAARPDVAVLATPAPMHLSVAFPLAAAGVHLFIEKPLSDRERGVGGFVSLCLQQDIAVHVGYNLRYTPALKNFRELLQTEEVGEILSVRAEVGQYLPEWRPLEDYRHGVSAKKATGGGILLELSHEIDYLLWLFGPIRSVQAIAGKMSDLEIDVEDTAHMLMQFCIGDRCVLGSLSMDCVRRDQVRNCTVVGSEGTLRWDGIRGTVECFKPTNGDWRTVFADDGDRNFSYIDELRYFTETISQQDWQPADVAIRDAWNVLHLIEAIRESTLTGRAVIPKLEK